MLIITINICLILFLMLISFQDFKQREISWILIPLCSLALLFRATQFAAYDIILKNTLLNITFVALQLLLLTIYMSIKNKKAVNILREHLGLGDVLFFVVLCIAFSPINFIVFYVISMMATLIGFVAYTAISSQKAKEIPLAGAMASFLVIAILIDKTTTHLNFYDDANLLNIINR